MSRVISSILIGFFIFSLALGCSSKEITSRDVIGTYIANYDKEKVAIDSIEVKEDGTYIHNFKSADDENNFINNGSWNFDYFNGVPRITFSNFTIGYEEPEGIVSKTGYIWSPEVQNNGARLLIDDDLGQHYDKQE